jgi:23S rRNA (guanine745-N1)-methyltransferase
MPGLRFEPGATTAGPRIKDSISKLMVPLKSGRCVRPLICPVCGDYLAEIDNTLKCPQFHSFDIAREGYVNLLLASRKRPKILGDTGDMLRARRDFLDRGFYGPLSDAVNEHVYRHLVGDSRTSDESLSLCITEVGCGEGYYIGRLKRYLDDRLGHKSICYFGMDISKEAARLAAKRYRAIRFVVASVKRKVLLAGNSVQVLLDIFAPRDALEFGRVMAQGGMLLAAIPGPGHLMNLRSDLDLLGVEANKQQRVVEQFAGTFKLQGKQTVEYEMHLNGEELANLIQMTPNYWHISGETWDRMRAMNSVRTKACFTILEFRR